MRIEVASRPRPARPGERERLLKNTENSRRVQRRLRHILIGGIPVVIALGIAGLDGTIVLTAAAVLGIVVGVGFWITSGHIREWNERMREIDRSAEAKLLDPH